MRIEGATSPDKTYWATTENILAAVDIKPNAVSINASSKAFQTYESGVITTNGTNGCGTSTNHAVVIIGY